MRARTEGGREVIRAVDCCRSEARSIERRESWVATKRGVGIAMVVVCVGEGSGTESVNQLHAAYAILGCIYASASYTLLVFLSSLLFKRYLFIFYIEAFLCFL